MSIPKDIYDPIHGFISVSPLLQLFIDTPEFQRLRDLKQLGATYFVYPSATHTRFEHSLGVCHLAGYILQNLKKNQPELSITKNQIDLIQLAALLHDLGHGPFSHLYDNYIIGDDEPEHEERGIKIFKNIVESNPIIKNRINNDSIKFVCDLINPSEELKNNWIYQIVCNKVNDIDVDKIDYILRDSYHIGLPLQGEFSRLISMVKVCNYKDNKVLAWNKKLQYEIFLLFSSRYRLHKQVYTHHTVKSFEYLIIPIIQKLTKKKIDFIDFTDAVVLSRLNFECKKDLEEISKRNIPILIGEKILTSNESITDFIENNPIPDYYDYNSNLFIYESLKIGLSNSRNPLDNVYYYSKDSEKECFKLESKDFSFIIPENYKEIIIRFYVKNRNKTKHIEKAKIIWNDFVKRLNVTNLE